MKAAQISEYGHANVIHIVDIPTPTISPKQVLVETHAAALNPFDSKSREGAMRGTLELPFPMTVGGDMAGVVRQVGDEVSDFAVGDKVYGQANAIAGNSGALAEFTAVKARSIAKMPRTADYAAAAAAVLTGVSAIQALEEHLHLQSGQKILIHGGAGGIGTMAIQLAKHLGAHVVTTATGDGLAYAAELGADEVIDYKNQHFEEQLHDFDAVFDTVGGETYQRSFQVLKQGGIIVSMVEDANQELMEQYRVTAIHQMSHGGTEILNRLTKLIDERVIFVHIDQTFTLDQVVQAFETLEGGGVKGKVVVEIRDL